MKTIFIVNPKAGRGKNFSAVMKTIKEISEDEKCDAELYVTKGMNDAERFVSDYCRENGPARFIACGGDGTFNEVLNGIIGYEDAEIGIIPIGTGNDFCRNFNDREDFSDIKKQILGSCIKCDVIKYNITLNELSKTGYCANMFNIGFDCAVADTTNELKRKIFSFGSFAYVISIFINLIKKKTTDLKIEIDGKLVHDGEVLLTSIANGCYCGGGLKTNPIAMINDGLININIVKNISRLRFLRLLPSYIKGSYLNIKDIGMIVSSENCSRVRITPKLQKIRISIDGEISDMEKAEFEIVHNAINFVIPSMVKNADRSEKSLVFV